LSTTFKEFKLKSLTIAAVNNAVKLYFKTVSKKLDNANNENLTKSTHNIVVSQT